MLIILAAMGIFKPTIYDLQKLDFISFLQNNITQRKKVYRNKKFSLNINKQKTTKS